MKLKYDESLSNVAFNFTLRRYILAHYTPMGVVTKVDANQAPADVWTHVEAAIAAAGAIDAAIAAAAATQ